MLLFCTHTIRFVIEDNHGCIQDGHGTIKDNHGTIKDQEIWNCGVSKAKEAVEKYFSIIWDLYSLFISHLAWD